MDTDRWHNLTSLRRSYSRADAISAGAPLEAFFEVSARCNLRCQMCAINHDARYRPRSGRAPLLEPEVFERLSPIFPYLLRAYLFGLGEPLLNPHLLDYVRTLSGHGVEVRFNSNATLIDDERAEELALAGTGSVTVSIDGATAATYERIRRGADFDSVLRGIKALVAARGRHGKPDVNLAFVAMASNIGELPELIDLGAELGVSSVHVEPLFAQHQEDLERHYARENLGVLKSSSVRRTFQEASARAEASGVRLGSRFLASSFAESHPSFDYARRSDETPCAWRCSEPWSAIWVTSAGEVRTCCINETSFGTLGELGIEEIWNGEAFQRFRDQHRNADHGAAPTGCANCRRNSRIRHSPFFESLVPLTYTPMFPETVFASGESSWGIEFPGPEATVTDPLIVVGSLPSGRPGWRPIRLELMIDQTSVATFPEAMFLGGSRFAWRVTVPYLSEGVHVLWLRDGEREWCHRRFLFWRPGNGNGDGTVVNATRYAAVLAPGRFRLRKPRLRVAGRPWREFQWLRRAVEVHDPSRPWREPQWRRGSGEIHWGMALVDLDGADAGDFVVELLGRQDIVVARQPVRKLPREA